MSHQVASPATELSVDVRGQDDHTEIVELPRDHHSAASLVLDDSSMNSLMRVADLMAAGKTTIPDHLRGNPGDCLAVAMQAMQWGMNPFAVAQKTHLVSGRLGYEAQLVNAVVNSSKMLRDRLHFEWFGDWSKVQGKTDKSADVGVRAWATLKGENEPRVIDVTMSQVGVRNSPLWGDDPRQQLAYLATKRWARLYAPDAILGVYTPDEIDNTAPLSRQTPAQIASSAAPKVERTEAHQKLIDELEHLAFKQGTDAFRKAWEALTPADRTAIGITERDRIKAICAETDQHVAAGVKP